MIRTTYTALLVLAAILCGCTQTVWIHRDYESIRPLIDSVAFIRPRIDYFEKIGKRMRLDDDSGTVVSRSVESIVTQILDERHLIPKSAVLIQVQIRDSIRITRSDGMKCALTPEIRLVMERAHAKYFICVQGSAFTTPEMSKQYDLLQIDSFHLFFDEPLSYEYQWNGLRLEFALVDVTSGEVLWYNRNAADDSNYNPLDREQVRSLCMKLCDAK